jgi:hypothetical protein
MHLKSCKSRDKYLEFTFLDVVESASMPHIQESNKSSHVSCFKQWHIFHLLLGQWRCNTLKDNVCVSWITSQVLPRVLCTNHKISISKRERDHNCGCTLTKLVYGLTLYMGGPRRGSMDLNKGRYLCKSMVTALEVDREAVAWYVCMHVCI